jgi:lycopene cyclase domain-containing protein
MIYSAILLLFGLLPITVLGLIRRDLIRRYAGSLLAIVVLILLISVPWELVSVNIIWFYSPKAIFGSRFLGLPVEELAFFIIDGLLVGTLALILDGNVPDD